MEWIKNNIITLIILIFLGFLVYESLITHSSYSSDYSFVKQLDSVKALVAEKNIENKILTKEKEDAEREKTLLVEEIRNQINQIQPKYVRVMSYYNKASPEQKKQYVSDEYQRRKQEMESESLNK